MVDEGERAESSWFGPRGGSIRENRSINVKRSENLVIAIASVGSVAEVDSWSTIEVRHDIIMPFKQNLTIHTRSTNIV